MEFHDYVDEHVPRELILIHDHDHDHVRLLHDRDCGYVVHQLFKNLKKIEI